MTFRRAVLLSVVVMAAILAASCAGSGSRPAGIVLITLDTTRADHLGCYGYDKAETPNLDRLAGESVLFADAMSPVPVTLPSHSSMFTGEYPLVHGVRYNGMFRLGDNSVTVAERLRDAGWRTAAVPAAYPVTTSTGVGQGFQVYRDLYDEMKAKGEEIPITAERNAENVTDLGIELLRERSDGPFFLWLHYFDPHAPYEPPFPYSSKHKDRPYDGEIAFMDAQIGRFLDEVKALGLWDRVMILVVGDHGEGLYDHGEKMHANLVYQSTQHVPLIVKVPGGSACEVEDPVSIIDVAPTILEYAGLPVPAMEAETLRPYLEGESPERRPQYFESLAGSLVFGWSPLQGVRDGRWKYTDSVDPELYDLMDDPGETVNLYDMEPEVAGDLEILLQEYIRDAENRGTEVEEQEVPMDPDEIDQLVALGYLGGSVTEERQGGASPREMIHLETSILHAGRLDRRGAQQESIKIWRTVLEADPENRNALHSAARASAKLGEVDRALQYAKDLVEIYPEFQPGWVTLGEVHARAGDFDSAEQSFRKGLEKYPGKVALTYRLAVALQAQGKFREAEEVAVEALGREDAPPSFRVILANCQAVRGEPELARGSLERAIREGYAKREVLESETLVAPLRKIPGFQELLALIPAEEE